MFAIVQFAAMLASNLDMLVKYAAAGDQKTVTLFYVAILISCISTIGGITRLFMKILNNEV